MNRNGRQPRPVFGPYSPSVAVGGFVFVSGQLGIDPGTGAPASGGVGQQTMLALGVIKSIIKDAGAQTTDLVRTTVYLADLGTFGEMNAAYADALGDHRPARTTVGAALPMGALVEIEAIAYVRSRRRAGAMLRVNRKHSRQGSERA